MICDGVGVFLLKEAVIPNIYTGSVFIKLKFNIRSKKSNWVTATQIPNILKKLSVQMGMFVYVIFFPLPFKKFWERNVNLC